VLNCSLAVMWRNNVCCLIYDELKYNIIISDYINRVKFLILSVVLYGCETWSLTLREEHRLRVFENRVLWRKFGPKRDEVAEEWRKLHNEELRDLYSLPSMIRIIKSWRIRRAGHVARMGRRETRIGYWWKSRWERDC
jgi:hypothetical protein